MISGDHRCYLRNIQAKTRNDKLVFFDFEKEQSSNEHVVNFRVAKYLVSTEFVVDGYTALDELCRFLFSPKHKGFTAIAHNMKGFDGQFVLRWLLENGNCPKVIPNRRTLISLQLTSFYHVISIALIDSCNFLPMPLSKLPKTFNLKMLSKVISPHLFNKSENQNYMGPIRDSSFYSPDIMSSGGPKNYAYRTNDGATACKIRGFLLNFAISLILNYESVKKKCCSLDKEASKILTNPRIIRTDKKKS
ncbi:hypothetical protein AVEN_83468-1 [Araneus ventricosus]|uniref:DNA-directed DNA polymerase n=1 Tax=Araneus ventricosus TaxID=182803 RepID=A0A4Y2JMD5_ARAVE|nr:hypothetical protein AVEN_83468-1 [Araneus ventricosus]